MDEIKDITKALLKFRDERDWEQFHDIKNLSIALSIEAAELNELFLWKDKKEIDSIDKTKIKEELADILAYCFLIANKYNFNVKDIIFNKIAINELKYPINKAKGSSKKYNELN